MHIDAFRLIITRNRHEIVDDRRSYQSANCAAAISPIQDC